MYEYYDAVLHAVREGLLLVDTDGRRAAAQRRGEAAARPRRRRGRAAGRPSSGCRRSLTRAVLATDRRPDEIHLVDDAVLVVNTAPARWQGREVGTRGDAARPHRDPGRRRRARHRPRARRVAALAEPRGRQPAAHGGVAGRDGPHRGGLDFATEELEVAQLLTDRVVGSVADPVVSALLLGKTAQAAERGVQLRDRRRHRRHRRCRSSSATR